MGSPCVGAAPSAGCGTSANYQSYEGGIVEGEVIGGSGYYGGEIIHDGLNSGSFQGRGSMVAPPMQSIQPGPTR